MAVSVSLKSFSSTKRKCVEYFALGLTFIASLEIAKIFNINIIFIGLTYMQMYLEVCLKPSQRSMVEIHCENHKMSQNGYRMSIFI